MNSATEVRRVKKSSSTNINRLSNLSANHPPTGAIINVVAPITPAPAPTQNGDPPLPVSVSSSINQLWVRTPIAIEKALKNPDSQSHLYDLLLKDKKTLSHILIQLDA